MQVGYTLAQLLPLQIALRVIPHWPIHLQTTRVMDSRLHLQQLPLLVLQPHAVKHVGEPDPHTLGAMLQVADHLSGEAAVHATLRRDLLLQEPQHVRLLNIVIP